MQRNKLSSPATNALTGKIRQMPFKIYKPGASELQPVRDINRELEALNKLAASYPFCIYYRARKHDPL